MKRAILLTVALAIATCGTARAAIHFDFEGPDDQGWTDVLTSSVANTDWNVVTSWPRGPAHSGSAGVAPGTGADPNGWNQRDGANTAFVFRSPAFNLEGSGDLTFWLFGGQPNAPAPANFNDLGVGPRTDFLGVALRDNTNDNYVLAKGKTGNGDSWQQRSFTQAELAPYVGGKYTLDLIDDKDNGWGWGLCDDITVPGNFGPQLVQPGGAGAIGEKTIADGQQNLAPGGTATQSSDYSGSYPAVRAIDGNYGNFSHTKANQPEQWWQVDLGATHELSEIKIFNRYANGHRLTNPGGGFRTSILDEFGTELWGVDDNVYTANPELRDLSGLTAAEKTGRTVRLSKLSPISGGDNGTINLAEVEVLATIPGDFTMLTGGTLEIELTPLELVTADKLALTGELTIQPDATLAVLLLSGSPAPGQTFDILDFGSVDGTFTTVNLPGGAGQWDTSNLYTTGEITFGAAAEIPEPITMLAVGLGIAGLGGYVRKRRRA